MTTAGAVFALYESTATPPPRYVQRLHLATPAAVRRLCAALAARVRPAARLAAAVVVVSVTLTAAAVAPVVRWLRPSAAARRRARRFAVGLLVMGGLFAAVTAGAAALADAFWQTTEATLGVALVSVWLVQAVVILSRKDTRRD